MKKLISISTLCVIIDQLLKILIINNFNLYEGINIIPNFFTLIRVHNTGAAWSILSDNISLLIFLSIFALAIIYILFIKDHILKKYETVTLGVLIGGILGNLFDRIFRGYVIDYLDFQIFHYNFPVFNFADICIVISVIILLILEIGGKHENN